MLRIRLRRVGKKKQPMYRIVVADSRAPRDGRFVEAIGQYHPLEEPSKVVLDEARARHWLDQGAQPSERVSKILAQQGIAEIPEKLKTRIALGEQRAKEAQTRKAEAAASEAPSEASAMAEAASSEASAPAEATADTAAGAPSEASAAAEAAETPAPEAEAPSEASAPAEAAEDTSAEAATDAEATEDDSNAPATS